MIIFISKSINNTTKSAIFPLFATSSVLLDMYVVLNEVMDIFPRLLQHVYSTSAWIRAGNEATLTWLNKKEFSEMMIANWLGLLICTLISENQGLEKLRSISNLDFFFSLSPGFFSGLWYKSSFFLGGDLEKNPGLQDLKIF